MSAPSEEEFAAWRDNPVTQWVMGACIRAANECREMWQDTAWQTRDANEPLLKEMTVRADAYLDIVNTSYEGWKETNDK